ncbi:MAG: lytic transglycosylase domain-containing protein [Spongiibacteraceae bacterium]|nr:lytic transglycosylase domain-containing protein [Spongiibacteraceae bacterium]
MFDSNKQTKAGRTKQHTYYGLLFIYLIVAALAVNAATNSPKPKQQVSTSDTELRDFLKNTINSADSFVDRFDAEVWLVDMSNRLKPFIKDPKQRLQLLRSIHREAKRAKLKPDLVLALIEVESHFDHYAVSSAGAQGLMQVMPFWKKEIGRPEDNLVDIETNLRYGCRILQFYIKKEKGNWMNALARYNGSLGQYWYPERVMNAWKKRWYTTNL